MKKWLALLSLTAACTFNLPQTITYPPDGSVSVGPRHLITATNGGFFITEDFHAPCLIGTNCGINWSTIDPGPDTFFHSADVRMYYDAPSNRHIGVSIGDSTHAGVIISQPDNQSWGPSFPRAAFGFNIFTGS